MKALLFLMVLCLALTVEAYKHKKAYHQKLKNHKKMNDKELHLLSNRVLHKKHDNNAKKHKFGHWGEHWVPKHNKKHLLGHKGEHWAAVKPKYHKSWANSDMHLQDLSYLEHKPSYLSTASTPTQAILSTHKTKVHHATKTPTKHHIYKSSKVSKKHYKKKYGKKKSSYKKY